MLTHAHRELKNRRWVVFFDSTRQFVDCSEDVLQFVGSSRTSLVKKSIDDLSYWLEGVPVLFNRFLRRGGLDGEYILRHESGAPLPIRYRAFVFPDGCKGACWEPITDWRAAYLAVHTETNKEQLPSRVDVALAAIYQTMYQAPTRDQAMGKERRAILEALSELSLLSNRFPSALSPEFLAYEKTRSALLRLSDGKRDGDALRVLFEENRLLIESLMHDWLQVDRADSLLIVLLDRIARQARYYAAEENPLLWLHNCVKLDCRRLRDELEDPREV